MKKILLPFLLALPLFTSCKTNVIQKPNVLFILVDDLGWKDLGCFGSTFYESPNIDKLAQTSVMFTEAYAAGPVCSPTRAAILTGKHPARIGITDWIPGRGDKGQKLKTPSILNELPLEEYTMAEIFKDHGYKTFFAGKWHLGGKGYFPEDQGFDINIGGNHTGQPKGGYYSPYKNPQLPDGPEGEYLTDRLTNETIKFIKESIKNSPDTPFFAYLSYYAVHTPIQACKRHIDKFRKKAEKLPRPADSIFVAEHNSYTRLIQNDPAYASMIYAMDENVGKLLKTLQKLNIENNTIIVFTSDNGGLSTLLWKGAPTSVYPLRAGKGWCYEGGVRIPLIIKLPGETKHVTIDKPVVSMDLYPTLVDLAGLHKVPKQYLDGVSIVPLFNGKDIKRSSFFWHYPHYHGSGWTPGAAIRKDNWKLIEFYEDSVIELYDLSKDTGEIHNLSEKFPEKTEELLKLLREKQKETGARFPELK
ncbi:MAG: sulfatase [Chlorobi bacterium]|nr:sulfatase [Chlorobiota bacterium]